MNGRLIYVAHPYGGLEENKTAIDHIMERLVLSDKINVYLSPLHNYSMVYFETEYAKGLQICLDMLEKCSVLILCGDWQHSKGCIGEWAYANARNIKIYSLEEWEEHLEKQGDLADDGKGIFNSNQRYRFEYPL